jgi:hypothetical protein
VIRGDRVDASALLEVLLRTPAARNIEERMFVPGQTLHAPHLVDLEMDAKHAVVVLAELWSEPVSAVRAQISANPRRLAQTQEH